MYKTARNLSFFPLFSLLLSVQISPLLSNVIDTYEWRDLELFASPHHSHDGLVGKFDQTATLFGKQQLVQRLKNPTTDTNLLKQRQQVLASLLSNTTERVTINYLLANIGDHADGLTGVFAGSEHEKLLEQEVSKMFYYQFDMLQDWNESSFALTFRHAFQQTALFTPVLEYIVFHLALEFIRGKLGNGHGHHTCGHKHGHKHEHKHDHESMNSLVERVIDAIHLGHLAMLPFSINELVGQLRSKINLMSVIYNRVAAASACFKAMYTLSELTQKNSAFQVILGEHNALEQLYKSPVDTEMGQLAQLLLSDQFPLDDQLSFFSSVGSTLKTYKLLQKNYERIKQALEVVGTIDAYCAIACHLEKHQSMGAGYCFVDFVNHDKPYLHMQALWNPLLNADTVITNDFCAGDLSNPATIILTGPNKAGKSSLIKALALNLVLAQTYGIAAAQACSLTPFHKILTYIMIMDDIATDQSKFVASILRADKCMQTISQLAPHEFAFGIFDDSLFEGTTHEKREAASLQFIKDLGLGSNAIIIAATHLHQLTTLELDSPRCFKNYRMQVKGTFIVEPGVCPPESIFDIIQGQGYNMHV